MNDNVTNDRDSLIEIYNTLVPSLQKQLIVTARIIEETQNTLLDELKNEEDSAT